MNNQCTNMAMRLRARSYLTGNDEGRLGYCAAYGVAQTSSASERRNLTMGPGVHF